MTDDTTADERERRVKERRVKERLPDWVAGRLDGEAAGEIERAVAADADLAEEAELLRRLAEATPVAPVGLADRITAAVLGTGERAERSGGDVATLRGGRGDAGGTDDARERDGATEVGRGRESRWLLAAAATVVLALGSVEVVERSFGAGADGSLEEVAFGEAQAPVSTDEEFVAGAPVLEALSDEALRALLAELEG